MKNAILQKVLRKLTAAEGYLELGMSKHALAELTKIDDAGPLNAARSLLEGLALKAEKRYSDAVHPLHRAAEELPDPQRSQAWMSLSECYQETGEQNLAEAARQAAQAATEQSQSPDSADSDKRRGQTTPTNETIVAKVNLTPHMTLQITIRCK